MRVSPCSSAFKVFGNSLHSQRRSTLAKPSITYLFLSELWTFETKMLTKDWSCLRHLPNFSLRKLKPRYSFAPTGAMQSSSSAQIMSHFTMCFCTSGVLITIIEFALNISLTESFVLMGMYSIIPGCVAAIIEWPVIPTKNVNPDLWRAKRCRTSCVLFPLNLIDVSNHMAPSNFPKISWILRFSHPAARPPRKASSQTKQVPLKHYNSTSQGCHKNEDYEFSLFHKFFFVCHLHICSYLYFRLFLPVFISPLPLKTLSA